jgi:hypothetical protein
MFESGYWADGYWAKGYWSSLSFGGIVLVLDVSEFLLLRERLNKTYDLTVAEILTLNEVDVDVKTLLFSTADSIVIVETLSKLKAITANISEVLTLSEKAYKLYDARDHLTIIQTLAKVGTYYRNINERLIITEYSEPTGNFYSRNIAEVLEIKHGMERLSNIGNFTVWIPEAIMTLVPKKCVVILEVPLTSSAIVLPCPTFNDIDEDMNKVIIKQSMNNLLYTYVRQNELQRLKYDFIVGRAKILQLEAFLQMNIAAIINLTNWKGEQWVGQITNEPINMTGKSLYEYEAERYDVTLEFQGFKIVG